MGTLGSRLKEFREVHCNMTQDVFAAECGVHQGNITQWETDNVKPSRLLSKIIKAFPELNIDWLETGQGDMLKTTLNKKLLARYANVPIEDIQKENDELAATIKQQRLEIDALRNELLDLYRKQLKP